MTGHPLQGNTEISQPIPEHLLYSGKVNPRSQVHTAIILGENWAMSRKDHV